MTAGAAPDALVLEGLTKTFEGQRALDRVDLALRPGEIHALLGQNGSGKSTLIKLLAGYHSPTHMSRAEVRGEPLDVGSAAAARAGGLHFIHQDLGLVPTLDAVDNLALGTEYSGRLWLSGRRERRAARELCERYGLNIDVGVPVATLSPAQQSMLAIVRALRGGVEARSIIALDEPTAALPDHEVAHLFGLLREVRAKGATVLYVTHRLAEVFEIADRVTVLRDGRRVGTREVGDLSYDELLKLIVGRPLSAFYPQAARRAGETALALRDIGGGRVRSVSLDVHRGETLGITGPLGSGYEQLLRMVFDPGRRRRGEVILNGRPVAERGVSAAIRSRIGYVPADRKGLASMPSWTVRENLTLPALRARGPARWLGTRRERGECEQWLARLEVLPNQPERTFSSLSGGNQQKVVLARWLRCGAEAYLLDEPTNGVDVGAKRAIYEAIDEVTAAGSPVVLSSSDAEELCSICDRVVVMLGGEVRSVLSREELTVETLREECARDVEREATAADAGGEGGGG